MRIVELSLAEAADPAVMKNVADFLLTGDHAYAIQACDRAGTQGVTTTTNVKSGGTDFAPSNIEASGNVIEPADRPDAGAPQGPTIADLRPAVPALPQPSPHVFVDAAAIGFGNNLPPVPAPPSAIPLPPLADPTVGQQAQANLLASIVPAVPAAAAVPTVPALPSAPAGVDVDANGLPWDSRIHASTKVKNADGTWRARRGVDPQLVLTVEAELRAVMAIPAPAAAPAQAQIPMPPPLPNPATPEAALQQAVTGAPADPFDALPEASRFPAWVQELEPAMIAEHIVPDQFKQVCGHDLNVFVMRADLIPAARKAMRDHLRATYPQAGY